jgi:hypothetical protein
MFATPGNDGESAWAHETLSGRALLELSDAPPFARTADDERLAEPEPWVHQYAALMLTRALIGTRAFWSDVERLRAAPTEARDQTFAPPARYGHGAEKRHLVLALLATAARAPDDDSAKASLHLRLVEAEPAWTPESEPPLNLEQSLDGIDSITEGAALVARLAAGKCWFHTTAPPTERHEAEWCPESAAEPSRYCSRHDEDFEHNPSAGRASRQRSVERVFAYAEPAILTTFAPEIAAQRDLLDADDAATPPSRDFTRRAG